MSIFDLGIETVEETLLYLEPQDVAAFAQTCSAARSLVYDKDLFWKYLYLRLWDEIGPEACVTWKDRVQRITRAQINIKRQHAEACDFLAINELLVSASSAPSSRNYKYVKSAMSDLHQASVPNRFVDLYTARIAKTKPARNATCGESSRLSLLLGISNRAKNGLPWSDEARLAAKSYIYHLPRYSQSNGYGPFLPFPEEEKHLRGEYADYQMLEAIMIVAGSNAFDIYNHHSTAAQDGFFPHSLANSRPNTMPPMPKDSPKEDWAGVTGKWRRAVSFLDYRDLMFYNLAQRTQTRQANFEEAVRLLVSEFRIVKFGSPDDEEGTAFPTLYIEGTSEGGAPHEFRSVGTVRKMKDGNVKWQMISIYQNEPRWYSSGVQVGGAKSAAGVYGIWTFNNSGVEHANDDPSGPFVLFKMQPGDPY